MFTFQAVYRKGVLKPRQKLNLPENAVVQVQVLSDPSATQSASPLGRLRGIWRQVSDANLQQMETDLSALRKKNAQRIKRLAQALEPSPGERS